MIVHKSLFIPANINEIFIFLKLIMMKRLILIFTAVLLAASAQAGDSLSVSLLTCSPGNDPASAFGHSGIRVTDHVTGRDLVFNYGTYSFQEPHFLLKFLRGDLDYCLSINYFQNFKQSYEKAGRGIIEQPMNLTPEQKTWLRLFLMDNAREENRYYRYDFLQDNCATRIRDIFDGGEFSFRDTLTEKTYRDELTRLVGDKRWMMFGIDLLLGARVDREITAREAMFLPDRLSENLARYTNGSLEDTRLMTECTTLVEPAPGPGRFMTILSKATSPFTVFTLLLLFYLIFFLKTGHKWRFINIFSTVLYAILGTGGIILTLMWLATNIEKAFNQIWDLPTRRNFFRRFSDYLAIILLTPIILVVLGSAGVLVRNAGTRMGLDDASWEEPGTVFVTMGSGEEGRSTGRAEEPGEGGACE